MNWLVSLFFMYLYPGVPDAPYWVLSTDYLSYALVYSCSDYFGLFHIDFAWILARTRVLTDAVMSQSHDKLATAGINVNRLTVTNQTGCELMTWDMMSKMKREQNGDYLFWTVMLSPVCFDLALFVYCCIWRSTKSIIHWIAMCCRYNI